MKNKNAKLSQKEISEKSHFDLMAEKYEENYGYNDKFTKYKIAKKSQHFVDIVKKYFKDKKNLSILEIGSGTGTYTIQFADLLKQNKIIASDISSSMIKVLQKTAGTRKNITAKVFSAYNTGLKDKSIDIVCGFYVLHHLNYKSVKKEILRILKPGGMVYFFEPNILNPVVYAIKSNKKLKVLVGDSEGEWAVNPLEIKKKWNEFNIYDLKTSEYIWPIKSVPYDIKLFLDKLTSTLFYNFPILKNLGGSIEICLIKK